MIRKVVHSFFLKFRDTMEIFIIYFYFILFIYSYLLFVSGCRVFVTFRRESWKDTHAEKPTHKQINFRTHKYTSSKTYQSNSIFPLVLILSHPF